MYKIFSAMQTLVPSWVYESGTSPFLGWITDHQSIFMEKSLQTIAILQGLSLFFLRSINAYLVCHNPANGSGQHVV